MCYKQKCKVVSLNLAHPVDSFEACKILYRYLKLNLFILFVKELLAADEQSSVYIRTVNKEKYRCSLPSNTETSHKVSVCVEALFTEQKEIIV